MPNTLNRLASTNTNLSKGINYSKLDLLFYYLVLLLELDANFFQKIIRGYK